MSNLSVTPLAPAPVRVPESRRSTVLDLTPVRKTRLDRADSTPRRLHQFFEKACDRTPDAMALLCGEEQFTYAELDAQANQLAHFLIKLHNIRPGDRVGLLLERSKYTYLALLAILKCGAAFVPIDPSYPADRIAFIAEDADPTLLLTTAKFVDALTEVSCPHLALDTDDANVAWQPTTRPEVDDNALDSLCYIIYTSGTTGRPKGVAIQQSNICNFISVCTPIYGVTAVDRVYQGMITAFDFSIEEIWPTFAAGATLVAGPNDHRRLGSGFADFLNERKITLLYCVPTLLATIDREVPSLRTLYVGGEACPADLVKCWSRPGARMLNTYGPTETTVTATWGELLPNRPVTIGKAFPTYTTYILDEKLQPVAPENSANSASAARAWPVGMSIVPTSRRRVLCRTRSHRAGTMPRLYRTGDLARFTPEGEIEFAGRIDSQVKIRGYRIELAEIEAVLLENAAVKDAIVKVAASEGGVQELVAYITLRGLCDTAALKQALYAEMKVRLPVYMVPAFLEIIESIPMLPSGKADRAKLPAPVSPRLSATTGTRVLPETELEKALAKAWGEVFGRDDLSVEEDFFTDLGGHSLLAAQVTSNLRRLPALRQLPISAVYAYPPSAPWPSTSRAWLRRPTRPPTTASRKWLVPNRCVTATAVCGSAVWFSSGWFMPSPSFSACRSRSCWERAIIR